MPIYASFDQETLDREYSPSSMIDDLGVYLERYSRESDNAKAGAALDGRCRTDLRYGAGREETLDLFLPAAESCPPVQVFIHGGYWQLLSKDESCFAAPLFQQHGSAFAALNYTLAPHQSLTGIVDEMRRAIIWLYRNADDLGIDKDRIFVSGHSAGAHLAMMLLLTDWAEDGLPANAIKGVCAVSGVFDLEPVRLTYVNDKVGMNADEARQNSPILHSVSNRCPVILAYGENETAEFKRQSDEYRTVIENAGMPVTLREIPARNHFDVILDLADGSSWLTRQVLAQMELLTRPGSD